MTVSPELAIVPRAERWLTAADGVGLFVRQFLPETSPPSRTVLWSHGVGEHGGRYDHVIQEFLRRGWQVILADLRGHGRSEGVRTDVAAFDEYYRDFDLLVREFQLNPARTALFGHSLGGLLMIRFAQTRPAGWAALTMSAPLLGVAVPIPAWKWWAGRVLALIAPRTHLRTGIRESNLTQDAEFLSRRRADPFIQRSVTARWFFAMLTELERAHQEARKLTLPILILQGTADQTTDANSPAGWLPRTRSTDPRLIEYPGGLHELFNDTGWQKVCAELLDWLEQRVPTVD